jgi:hypothetical protein
MWYIGATICIFYNKLQNYSLRNYSFGQKDLKNDDNPQY